MKITGAQLSELISKVTQAALQEKKGEFGKDHLSKSGSGKLDFANDDDFAKEGEEKIPEVNAEILSVYEDEDEKNEAHCSSDSGRNEAHCTTSGPVRESISREQLRDILMGELRNLNKQD